MSDASMRMTRVIVGIRIRTGENAGKRIYPGTRSQIVLISIRTRALGIGATCAQPGPVAEWRAPKAAPALLERKIHVLQPPLAPLLEPLVVRRAPAHPIKVLGYNRVIG